MARIALSMIAEPNDTTTGYVLARHGRGRDDAADRVQRRSARPGTRRRVDVARTGGGADHARLTGSDGSCGAARVRHAHPVRRGVTARQNDLGESAPYLLWTRGAASFLTTPLSDRASITGARAHRRHTRRANRRSPLNGRNEKSGPRHPAPDRSSLPLDRRSLHISCMRSRASIPTRSSGTTTSSLG